MNSKYHFQRFLFVSALALVLGACKNEPKNDAGVVATPRCVGSAATAITPGDSYEAFILTQNYWVFEFYVIPGNREASITNKGKWYVFNKDGTFESGQWTDVGCPGTWMVSRGEKYPILHLDSQNDSEDSEYEIQGINSTGDAMSWVGTKTYGQSAVMIKPIKLLAMPTRKQFGLE